MSIQSIREQFLTYIQKYLQNKATKEEIEFLEKYYTYFEKEPGITDQFTEAERDMLHNEMLREIWNKTNPVTKTIPIFRKTWFRYAAAAVAVLCISTTFLIFRNNRPVNEINQIVEFAKPSEKPLYKNDVKPGGNKAVLTLADGTKITLDEASDGTLTKQGNTTIIKLDDGRLAYNPQSISKLSSKAVLYNTLTTPRGGQYCVTLSDGTIVWLNASTSLRFPIAFNGNERRVEVHGEAYFEVAKNEAMPFIVKAGNEEIKVLGTHFNVSAYADDKLIKTTLLEGSVMISLQDKPGNESIANTITLLPGQQAQIDMDNNLKVVEANLKEAIAWKNGYFFFRDENIESIMAKISRWYDVKIIYEANTENLNFTGNISRTENISGVLSMLEKTDAAIHFKLENKTVTILSNTPSN